MNKTDDNLPQRLLGKQRFPEGSGHQIQSIAQYYLRRVIGSGGFGVVYLAEDMELERQVAIKLPRIDALFDTEKRARFAAEAMMAARLDHSGIVKVYEANLDGVMPFIASEFCDGPNLSEWRKAVDHQPPWEQCAELVANIADAVAYAHRKQVFHRDLKPANIMVTLKDPDQGEQRQDFANWQLAQCDARLTDFGLAKIIDSAMTETRTSQVIGTPLYMAPEQIDLGDAEHPTAAIDIYSLGVILFELLTGEMPINGSSYINALDNIRKTPPCRLSEFRKELPRDLQNICTKCLEKDPHARYSSASELAEDLRRCVAGKPILGKSVGIGSRIAYWCTRPQRVSTTGWFAIGWVSLVAIWITFNVFALPVHTAISTEDYVGALKDLCLLMVTGIIPMLWLGRKTLQGKSWALWGLLIYSICRLPLLMNAMVSEPVYFTVFYQDNPTFSFIDHSMMMIATGVQLFLCVCAIAASRKSIIRTGTITVGDTSANEQVAQ